jgi:hypothetical protein
MYQNVCPPCTTSMYINTIKCTKRYHQWNVSTICLYQHANHVHILICQPCATVISLMICLHHEPSATIMYLNQSSVSSYHPIHHVPSNSNGILLAKYLSSKHIPSMSVPNMYINMYHHLYQEITSTMHQYHNKMNPHTCMPNPPQNMLQSNC